MSTLDKHIQHVITLEDIVRMKAEKLEEIRASKERIHTVFQDLFQPRRTDSASHILMNNLQSGVAIIKGIITGFKVINRIRNFFREKK